VTGLRRCLDLWTGNWKQSSFLKTTDKLCCTLIASRRSLTSMPCCTGNQLIMRHRSRILVASHKSFAITLSSVWFQTISYCGAPIICSQPVRPGWFPLQSVSDVKKMKLIVTPSQTMYAWRCWSTTLTDTTCVNRSTRSVSCLKCLH